MTSLGRPYEVREGSQEFTRLLSGKPFVLRPDLGFERGDMLIIREYDEMTGKLTGTLAIFQITWLVRPGEGLWLIHNGSVVLGLAPANVVSLRARVAEAATSPCCGCGVRTAEQLLRKVGEDLACPFCAPILRLKAVRPGTGEPVGFLEEAARAVAGRLRSLAKEHGLEPAALAAVVPAMLAELFAQERPARPSDRVSRRAS
jgi:hypothetical protein